MNKMRKKLSMVVLGVVLVMALSVTAFASSAWDSFSTKLPANQGDTEVSTVARASDSVDHFNIQINSLSNGYTAVRAWAEGSWGGNYSDPYWELGVGSNWNVYYYSNNIPSKGTNITLNLDNPVMAKNTQITLTARTNHTVSSISMSVKNPNGATTNLGTVTNTNSISKVYTPTVAAHPNDLYTVTVTAVSADGVTTSSTWTFRTY